MAHLYVVKLRQPINRKHNKQGHRIFPYDRLYLIPPPNPHAIAYELFKYSLVMPLTRALITRLSNRNYTKTRDVALRRNNTELAWVNPTGNNNKFPKLTTSWLMVVPTFFYTNRQLGIKENAIISGELRLAYSLSHAIRNGATDLHPPTITLHTPQRNIPFLCAACKHITRYHAGECTPMQPQCREELQLYLPDVYAAHHREETTPCPATDLSMTASNA